MIAGIYKPGQGYWTRTLTAIAVGVLALMGAVWLWDVLKAIRIEGVQSVYISAAGAVVFVGVLGVLTYYLVGRKRGVVDFMIAVEGEMKKVNWSSRREILGSTWVVIGFTLFIAVICALLDNGFAWFFTQIDVLEI